MSAQCTSLGASRHRTITPSVLYFGTPVVLVTTNAWNGRLR